MMTSVYSTLSSIGRSHSRDSNMAGAPLPHLPRRTSSSSRTLHRQTASASHILLNSTAPSILNPPVLVVEPPTPPHQSTASPDEGAGDDGSESSSSSGSESRITVSSRPKRVRGQRTSVPDAPDAQESVPFPSERPAKPTAMKRIVSPPRMAPSAAKDESARPRATVVTAPHTSARPAIGVRTPSHQHTQSMFTLPAGLIRKKSGEPLKSSLKSRAPIVRSDLSVFIPTTISSKSAPVTPTAGKAVHFDAKLEHVKLFIAQQKPSAVSRDGSPTDDTSGTDTDWPSFIFGQTLSEDERTRKSLVMRVVNMPDRPRMGEDVVLEELVLSADATTANGRVRVRNIAFEKWVAVRFTFDDWQTTSEMTAKYFDSVEHGAFDRFTFSIRLTDMMARIEEKTLFIAIRYTSAGREIWDNNRGENYQVKFTKKQPPKPVSRKKSAMSLSDEEVADLKGKLEEVARVSDGGESAGDASPLPPAAGTADRFSFKSDPLSTRYDFASSAKAPWRPTSPRHSVRPRFQHARTVTHTGVPESSHPWTQNKANPARKALADVFTRVSHGSPRDRDDDDVRLPLPYDNSDDDRPFHIPARRGAQRGYFDLAPTPVQPATAVYGFSRSPMASPRGVGALSSGAYTRYNSFPQTADEVSPFTSPVPTPAAAPAVPEAVVCPVPKTALLRPAWSGSLVLPCGGGSEDSTPSITSEESVSSRENSPTPSPREFVEFLANITAPEAPASPVDESYSAFVNR